MHTRNETVVAAPPEPCVAAARDVERWPDILPHYREVRFFRRDGPGRGRVRMSAYRHFGPLPWPTWWESEMVTDEESGRIRYRHVAGITEGMDVLWEIRPLEDEPEAGRRAAGGPGASGEADPPGSGVSGSRDEETGQRRRDAGPRTRIVILHDWDGPGWPLVGPVAARRVIGPHFVKVVADRTLAGIRRTVEDRWRGSPGRAPPGDPRPA